ncbi:DoxX family protein [Roseateles sp. DAIF2]|uniref:DoxX family protein n=1 Tax=Roseateles sp. DAIF2 TaxID=2714952 RepID=UPI0018A315CC|nr:DoxX family protein [Roseateles sp. DAIF2]QPF75552.1 DoxX family protein [Roseateles sp. DAIF2]
MAITHQDALAKLILRLSLGLLTLLHGIGKLVGGPGFILGLMSKHGLPEALGYLVYVGEVLAPLLLIAGLWTRAAALVIAVNMLVAIALVHAGQLFELSKSGGWALELQGFFLFTALALMFSGAGRYSLGGSAGRWN